MRVVATSAGPVIDGRQAGLSAASQAVLAGTISVAIWPGQAEAAATAEAPSAASDCEDAAVRTQ